MAYDKQYYENKLKEVLRKKAKSKDNIIDEMVRIQNASGIAINAYFELQRDYDDRIVEINENLKKEAEKDSGQKDKNIPPEPLPASEPKPEKAKGENKKTKK